MSRQARLILGAMSMAMAGIAQSAPESFRSDLPPPLPPCVDCGVVDKRGRGAQLLPGGFRCSACATAWSRAQEQMRTEDAALIAEDVASADLIERERAIAPKPKPRKPKPSWIVTSWRDKQSGQRGRRR